MQRLGRRAFLRSALAGATVAIGGTKANGRIVGANDSIRLAVAGLNGRGKDHVTEFSSIPGVTVTHLVDPDTRTFARRQKQLRDLGRPEAKVAQDIRTVIESKDVDAISVATPNHWHALIAIWACQAGKDVYVEKPCSHNLNEGVRLIEAAAKYQRIVQHGTQRRCWKPYQQLAEVVRSGHYGPLRISRGVVYKLRPSIGKKPDATPPAELDFDLWLGPAAARPFHANLVHYNWHWFWDFGNGDIGNQGVHQMDVARWMIPGAGLPKSVFALGGRFGYSDQGETPNTQLALFDYGTTQLIFEVRGLPTAKYPHDPKNEGSILHFDDGVIADFQFWPKNSDRSEPLPTVVSPEFNKPGSGNHFANFIACVRSRRREDLFADVVEGHRSSALCHLANMSYRLGNETCMNPKPAFDDATWQSTEEHLIKTCGLKPESASIRVGRRIELDSNASSVLNDPEAAALSSRQYRAPFAMPEKV